MITNSLFVGEERPIAGDIVDVGDKIYGMVITYNGVNAIPSDSFFIKYLSGQHAWKAASECKFVCRGQLLLDRNIIDSIVGKQKELLEARKEEEIKQNRLALLKNILNEAADKNVDVNLKIHVSSNGHVINIIGKLTALENDKWACNQCGSVITASLDKTNHQIIGITI